MHNYTVQHSPQDSRQSSASSYLEFDAGSDSACNLTEQWLEDFESSMSNNRRVELAGRIAKALHKFVVIDEDIFLRALLHSHLAREM